MGDDPDSIIAIVIKKDVGQCPGGTVSAEFSVEKAGGFGIGGTVPVSGGCYT